MQDDIRLTDGDFIYRDLNKNGRLDPYEDTRRPVEERVEDLLSQLTLQEKAGLMFHTMAMVNPDGSLDPAVEGVFLTPIAEMVSERLMNHFNVLALPTPRDLSPAPAPWTALPRSRPALCQTRGAAASRSSRPQSNS